MAKTFLLFTTPTCPNCPAAKQMLKKSGLVGEYIDASKPEGLQKASEYDIMEVPAAVFFEDGEVVKVVSGKDDIEDELNK